MQPMKVASPYENAERGRKEKMTTIKMSTIFEMDEYLLVEMYGDEYYIIDTSTPMIRRLSPNPDEVLQLLEFIEEVKPSRIESVDSETYPIQLLYSELQELDNYEFDFPYTTALLKEMLGYYE